MKNGTKKMVTLLLAAAMAASALAGCGNSGDKTSTTSSSSSTTSKTSSTATGGSETVEDPYAPIEGKDYTFTWIGYQVGPVDEDPIVIEHFEELLNCQIEVINIDATRWDELLNIKLAGGEVPDMFHIRGESRFNEYLKQDILAEIPEEAYAAHMPNAYAFNHSDRYIDYAEKGIVDGVRYGIASGYQYFGEFRAPLVARGDWMENLGITKAPETLDELEQMVYAFAKDDPDGNGQDDTYGLSSGAFNAVYGAFGSLGIWYEEDGKLEYGPVRDGRKDALAVLQRWYADGVIDPEFITGENQGGYWAITHTFDQGRIGLTGHGSYYHWFNGTEDPSRWSTNAAELYKVNPEAAEKLVFLQPPVGPDGERGLQLGEVWSNQFIGFGKQLEQEPDKMGKLMEVIIVMFQKDYGSFTEIGDTGTALYFAHTGDNNGPQSTEQIEELYTRLHEQYPGVRLRAATLEDVAETALRVKNLPVVTGELGDSWIHGTGSDPKKVSGYRALLRLARTLPEAEREAVYDALLPVPEHTWGLDEKSYLNPGSIGEHRYFIRTEFEQMRSTAPFRMMEASWQEQRDYVENAVKALSGPSRALAEQALAETSCPAFDPAGYEKLDPTQPVRMGAFTVTVGETGALTSLVKGEQQLAARPWGQVVYEAFSQHELDRFWDRYSTTDGLWAVENYGKIGCDAAISQQLTAKPVLEALYRRGDELVCLVRMEGEAFEKYGAPEKLALCWTFHEGEILLDLLWWNKPATRVAEGLWVTFCPPGAVTGLHKLGQWVDPLDVVPGGNRRLHAVDTGVRCGSCMIETLDAPLVSVGGPCLLDFRWDQPDTEAGVWFNLYNNTWGTNFRMWYDEDARFRFRIALPEQK